MFDRLQEEELYEKLKFRLKPPTTELKEVQIKASGTVWKHGLGRVPREITIEPLWRDGGVATCYWHYRKPDSENLYLRASVDSWWLISVGG